MQSIKDNYKAFDQPYNGKDNDDYVNGQVCLKDIVGCTRESLSKLTFLSFAQQFCCEDGTPEAAQTRAMDGAKAANDNFHDKDAYEKMQFYYHPDHLGSSSYITNLDGEVSQHIEYVPFGEVFLEERNNTWNTPYLFNAKEFDEETGMYYYGARYYEPRLSLWMSTDPLQEKYPNINTYCYTINNPIIFIDPDGKDWFKYQAKNEKTATWHYHKGSSAIYIGTDGKKHTSNNGFEYLAMFTKTYKNKDGGTGGKLVLFHQDKKVVDSQAFSGNSNHKSTLPIANGDYYMRLDIRTTSNPVKLLNTAEGPQPEIQWGLENFPKNGTMVYNGNSKLSNSVITKAYGYSRIRLIPAKDLGNNSKDRGLYLHGKLDTHSWTHGCLCDKKERIQNYFLYGVGKGFRGRIPLSVR